MKLSSPASACSAEKVSCFLCIAYRCTLAYVFCMKSFLITSYVILSSSYLMLRNSVFLFFILLYHENHCLSVLPTYIVRYQSVYIMIIIVNYFVCLIKNWKLLPLKETADCFRSLPWNVIQLTKVTLLINKYYICSLLFLDLGGIII